MTRMDYESDLQRNDLKRLRELEVAERIALSYARESRELCFRCEISRKEMDARIEDARLAYLAAAGQIAQMMLSRPALRVFRRAPILHGIARADGNPYAI